MPSMTFFGRTAGAALIVLAAVATAGAQTAVSYRVSFPEPEHRWMQVEATFADVPAGPLQVRMSRTSPGRYALHEFAKNVFDVRITDGKGTALTAGAAEPAPVGRARPRRHGGGAATACSAIASTAPTSASTPRTPT